MKLLIKLAFRNLTRNRTRTLLNLTMVIGAFTSIVIFKGFSNYMLWTVEDGMTNGQTGHIQIASEEIWSGDLPKDKEKAFLKDYISLQEKISKLPEVLKVSGRANAPVLLSNSDKTVGAFALGFDPVVENNIEKMMVIKEGKGFSEHPEFEVLVGAGLQDSLQLKIGQTVSVVSQALSGSMSSVDLEVRGIVNSGFVDIDNSTIYVPLVAAQKLLETNRVEKIAILLKDGKTLDSTKENVRRIIQQTSSENSKLVVKDWKDLSLLFRQVNDFYSVQNLVIELILSILVFFGILNTVGMSVYERIGEIGTLRALGDQKKDVFSLLLGEGIFLGIIGAIIGIPTAWLVTSIFSSLGIELVMPGASIPVPIQIVPVLKDYLESSVIVILTCFVSTLWPSMKAMRLSIVDALRSNS